MVREVLVGSQGPRSCNVMKGMEKGLRCNEEQFDKCRMTTVAKCECFSKSLKMEGAKCTSCQAPFQLL